MAAPNHKPPLLLLLLATACASTDVSHEPRPMAEAASKTPAPAGLVAPSADEEFADLETSLEAYEQQLASNEARLRAMGVLVAARDDNNAAEAEPPGRFAPPPPAMTTPPRKPADLGDADVAGSTRPTESAKQPDPRTKDAKEKQDPQHDKKRASRPSAGGKAGTTSASSPAPVAAPRTDTATADSPARAEARQNANRGRCAELCDLADSTCDLEGKICDLAARHPGEARFAEVCRRADEDCRIAAEACTVCSP